MPAKSPEAIARKKQRNNERRRKPAPLVLQQSDLPAHKISKRRMMPKLGHKTKDELRAMIAQAVRNTKKKP